MSLCDIWRVRNPKKQRFTFRQKHFTGFIQRTLDYIFISRDLQECIKKSEIINTFSTDHSTVFCSFLNNVEITTGPGLWKFNKSLVKKLDYVEKMKQLIQNVKKKTQ